MYVFSGPMNCCIKRNVPPYCLGPCTSICKDNMESRNEKVSFGLCEEHRITIEQCQDSCKKNDLRLPIGPNSKTRYKLTNLSILGTGTKYI